MIALERVRRMQQDRIILNDINISFSDNCHYVIFGESGSGKTTLLNIIAGYEQADSGLIKIDKGAKIEYLFQDALLFTNISVRENMLIKWLGQHQNADPDEFQKKAMHALELFSVGRFMDSKVHSLSGGEKRRVEFAQMFLSNPDLLLLDEPTSNLDAENKRLIIETIHKNFQNAIVILVSHDDQHFFPDYVALELKEGTLYHE